MNYLIRTLKRFGWILIFALVVPGSDARAQSGPMLYGANSSTLANVPVAPEAERVHVVIVIADKDPVDTAKLGLEQDRENLEAIWNECQRNPEFRDRIFVHVLRGDQATYWGLRDCVAALKIGHNDTLVVSTAGHGCIDPARGPIKGRQLVLNDRLVYCQDVLEIMTQFSPRLAVLLTDACSSMTPDADSPVERSAETVSGPSPVNTQAIRSLFFSARGVAFITAAEAGEFAYGGSRTGGIFCCALVSVLRQSNDKWEVGEIGMDSWSKFFGLVKSATQDISRSNGGRNNRPQAPELVVLRR